MFKWKGHTFLHWEIISKCKSTFMKFKTLLLLNYWASFIIYIIITSLKCINCFELVSQWEMWPMPLVFVVVCLFVFFFWVYKIDLKFDVSILNYPFEETSCRRHGLYFYNVDIYLKYFIIENIYLCILFHHIPTFTHLVPSCILSSKYNADIDRFYDLFY